MAKIWQGGWAQGPQLGPFLEKTSGEKEYNAKVNILVTQRKEKTSGFFVLESGKNVGPQGPQGPQEKTPERGTLAPLGPQEWGPRPLWGARSRGPGPCMDPSLGSLAPLRHQDLGPGPQVMGHGPQRGPGPYWSL